MKVPLLRLIFIETLHLLHFRKRRKGYDIKNLCLATLKHRRAMHTRDEINLCRERSDLIDAAAVRSLVIL